MFHGKEARLPAALGPSLFAALRGPRTGRLWHAGRIFPIPCPAFRCSLICRLYFYLPSPPAPGLSAFTRLLMSICSERGRLGRPAAPIRGLSAGDWACCPPRAPQAPFTVYLSQVSPRRRLPPPCLSAPRLLPPYLPCFPPPRAFWSSPGSQGE